MLNQPVACDPARIAQLLSNLMANAISHGEPGAPVVVTARHEDGKFTLEVANRGEPIPADKQARLFQPFTRGDRGNPNKGLGLGLYISGEIARAHGGFIKLDSAGNETRFKLVIPGA
jgi:sigma-B regulation protein RsbU (phosphoserine phosphatase)